MRLSSAVISKLKEQYPYATAFLDCFIPLEELSHKLAKELPPPIFPKSEDGVLGKSLYPAHEKELLNVYLDEALLAIAPQICLTAAACTPKVSDDVKALAEFLPKKSKPCKQLASLVLTKKPHRIADWAKKHDMPKDAAALVGTYLAHCAALRVALHVTPSASWDKNFCPVCGSIANAGYLKEKEGNRYLHCSLCNTTWRYSRTVCPVCEDNRPENRLVYNLEGGSEQLRAEGCKKCKHYIIVPDIRTMGDTVPLSILLYCLMPMDMLMQKQGYTPIS